MKEHYSEADLLETYYTQPGESLPVMMHLAACSDCAARYERLERKLRALAAHDCEQPAAFWSRQSAAITRRIEESRAPQRFGRIAAAASLAFVLGGTFVWPFLDEAKPVRAETSAEMSTDIAVPADPWDSDALDELRPIVEWESWIDNGGNS